MQLTPYVLAAIGLLLSGMGWLTARSVKQGETIVKIETTLKFYFDHIEKGAAGILDSDNPTPPEIRALLRKFRKGGLTDEERTELIAYLRRLRDDECAPKAERGAAVQLLSAMQSNERLSFRREHKWAWLSKLNSLWSRSS